MSRAAVFVTLVALALLGAAVYRGIAAFQRCDTAGRTCCGPDAAVKTNHCHKGLGCNITSNKCEACGAPGQPCCDGDFTGFSNKSYSGILLDPTERIESCNGSASCDAKLAPDGISWTGTRLCGACGQKEGGSCCPPDVRYALGRCFDDAQTGKHLTCNDPWAGASSTCIPCGRWAGDRACMQGRPCGDWMVEVDGFCRSCGQPEQPVCDRGKPCIDQAVPDRWYTTCVLAGGPNQPCLENGTCRFLGLFCNSAKICEPCGSPGQACCPGGNPPCQSSNCENNRCFACGYVNMPFCPGADPCPHGGEPIDGMCRPCGKLGEPCCRKSLSIVCDDVDKGVRCEGNTCQYAGGAGPGSTQWKTCSGQPYTWSTQARPVFIEDKNGCVAAVSFIASTPEEALQCARTQYGGDAVIANAGVFTLSVTCPNTGCANRQYTARDQASAEKCAEATSLGCTVSSTACP
jgi:hypothetical protein